MSQTELEPVGVVSVPSILHDALIPNDEAQGELAPSSGRASSLSRTQACLIVVTIAGISFLNTLGSGLLTVSLPRIATDLQLAPNLILWPASVYALTMGCSLLLLGTVADVVGNRPIFLAGCLLLSVFTLGCSLVRTGIELIAFRALQGIAMAFCMPTAVGLITSNFPAGRGRNVAFACLGGGSPIGFALGLVLGGLFVDSIGWRYGYYLSCGLNGIITLAAFFTIPTSATGGERMKRLRTDVDWVGVSISSVCMAMLSYVFAMITSGTLAIWHPPNVALLAISVVLMPAFVWWVGWQERLGKLLLKLFSGSY